MTVLSLHVNSINIKGNFFSKFSNKCCTNPHVPFLFIVILHISDIISDIISTLWRYRNKSRSRPRLLEQFSFCHWNLNSIASHDFIKMQAYNAIHRFDVICLLETYLDNYYHTGNDQLAFPGYNLIRIRADNPNNTERGGVCIYY